MISFSLARVRKKNQEAAACVVQSVQLFIKLILINNTLIKIKVNAWNSSHCQTTEATVAVRRFLEAPDWPPASI